MYARIIISFIIITTFVMVGASGLVYADEVPGLSLEISSSNSTPMLGESVSFTLAVQNGIEPYSFCWDFGTPATTQKVGEWNQEAKLICYSTSQNPTHAFNQYGQYEVQVFVKDNSGNTAKAIELINLSVRGTTIDPTQDCGPYNLIGDDTTDNQNFLSLCLQYIAGPVRVLFPPGKYRFSKTNGFPGKLIELTSSDYPLAELVFDPSDQNTLRLFTGQNEFYIHNLIITRDTHGQQMYKLPLTQAFYTPEYVGLRQTYQNLHFSGFTTTINSLSETLITKSNVFNGAHGIHLEPAAWTNLGDGRYSTPVSLANQCRALFVDEVDRLDKASNSLLTNGSWYHCLKSGDKCVTEEGGSPETVYFRPNDGVLDNEEIYCGQFRSATSGVTSYNYYRNNYWKGYEKGHGHCIYGGDEIIEPLYTVGNYFGGPYHRSGSCFETFGFEQMYVYNNKLIRASVHPGSPQHAEWIGNSISDVGFLPGMDVVGTDFTFSNNCMDRANSTGEAFIFRGNLTLFNSMSIKNNIFGAGIPNSPWAIYDFDLNRSPDHWDTCGECVHGKYNDPNPNVPGDCDPTIASCVDVSGCTCGEWQGNVNSDLVCDTSDPGFFEFEPPVVQSFVARVVGGGTIALESSVVDSGSGMGHTPRFPYQEGGIMQFSHDQHAWSEIIPYNSIYYWNSQGSSVVYARYRDVDGNWTSPVEAQLVTLITGDINGDGRVDIFDYNLLVAAFGTANAAADLNADGVVDMLDYGILMDNFGG